MVDVKRAKLDRWFGLAERGSSVRTELLAGLSMFFASAYAVVVIPGMLAKAGVPHEAATTGTILTIVLATAAVGFFANMPFMLAPGLGGTALVAATLIQQQHVPYPVAMGMVFWSGIAILVLSVLGLRGLLAKVIPDNIRLAIGTAIGLFIVYVGFKLSGMLEPTAKGLDIGDLGSAEVLLALGGIVLVAALQARKVPGAFVIGIVALTIIGIPLGVTELPDHWFQAPAGLGPVAFDIDVWGALRPEYLQYLFAFFASELFSATGVVLAVTERIGLTRNSDRNINRTFLVDSVAITGGSLVGAPSVTTYAESAAGSDAGGRTGLTSLTTAGLFLLLLLLTPFATMIPSAATAPVLIVVGLSMMRGFQRVDLSDLTEAVPAALLVTCTIFWGNFGNGIAAALTAYVLIKVVAGRWRDVHLGMWILLPFLLLFFFTNAH
ncbi:NCS2 family permease [Saccharopolyspora sp. WRP15-2]|uniref:NCS2 family permease n=1 Tax=Saccharopolyspora oryzae TaxID=2997343 RepID=A0ABT4UT71_9PSEU|nr:NCS2 family permease [Saccharopolyspora oryzae]MDA3624913.1 NCS2 family permease [Saccharopolyspora oryzae]